MAQGSKRRRRDREGEQPAAPSIAAPGAAAADPPPSAGLRAFYLHLHPRLIRRRTANLSATLGLGLATLLALGVATLSGLLLMIYYVPSVEQAHHSVQDLMGIVPLGRFIRALHRWSAHLAVLACGLHVLRALLWGAYRGDHARVWLLGVGLLLVTLATSFSGYLLPWDQDAYWTVTVGTSLVGYVPLCGEQLKHLLLGSDAVGQAALTRYFALHVLVLPATMLLLLLLHFFRLRRAGGLARPSGANGPGETLVPASPLLTSRELTLALSLGLMLIVLALAAEARLGPAPDLLRPDNPPKAPWFLVGFQEMVSYSATVGGVIMPGLLLVLLFGGPWLDGGTQCDGEPLPGRRARLVVIGCAVAAALTACCAVFWWGDAHWGKTSWLNPATITLAVLPALLAVSWLVSKSRSTLYQAAMSGLLAALVIFTLVGWFWRGPDWSLVYHPGPGHAAPPAAAAQSTP